MNAIDPPEPLSGQDEKLASAGWVMPFRLVDAVVVIVVLLGCAGLLLPATRTTREPSRRIQCVNNLKQIGLGVHNFHDTFGGLPPLAIGDSRASMFVMIYPFCEAQNVYNLYDGGNVHKTKTGISQLIAGEQNSSWELLNAAELNAASSVKWMSCPSRRSGIQLSSGSLQYAGPLGDYAVVFIDQDSLPGMKPNFPAADVSANTGWFLHQDPCDLLQVNRQKGLLRLANVPCDDPAHPDYKQWKPRDTFARCTDGTANTLIVGEKHVRNGELGRYANHLDDQDGSYLFTSAQAHRAYNVARNIRLPMANGPNDRRFVRGQKPPKGPRADFGFGSWHSGVVCFLKADGSVESINANTDPQLLSAMGHAQDGYELPNE